MNSHSTPLPCPFDARERDLIRREFGRHFGQPLQLADGIFLRTWRAGPKKNQPKLPPAVRSMLERGLLEVRPGHYGPCAFFTAESIAAMRRLAADSRLLNPVEFAHLRRELGLDPAEQVIAP